MVVTFTDQPRVAGRHSDGGGEKMEIKEEFYEIMTARTAEIYHDVLGIDIILADGAVLGVEMEKAPSSGNC